MNKVKDIETLQSDIIKRFMSDEEWKEFRNSYYANRKHATARDRSLTLSLPIAEAEKEALIAYITRTDETVRELGKEFSKTNGQYTSAIRYTALKVIYQNSEILQRIK